MAGSHHVQQKEEQTINTTNTTSVQHQFTEMLTSHS